MFEANSKCAIYFGTLSDRPLRSLMNDFSYYFFPVGTSNIVWCCLLCRQTVNTIFSCSFFCEK